MSEKFSNSTESKGLGDGAFFSCLSTLSLAADGDHRKLIAGTGKGKGKEVMRDLRNFQNFSSFLSLSRIVTVQQMLVEAKRNFSVCNVFFRLFPSL